MSYGGVGIKTILGHRNTGILLSIGKMPETTGYEIGLQLSFNWFYTNIGYGILGTYQVNNEPVETIEATNINIGAMINIGKDRRTYFDLGVGGTIGAKPLKLPTGYGGSSTIDQNDFTLALGVGYRIGGYKVVEK